LMVAFCVCVGPSGLVTNGQSCSQGLMERQTKYQNA
jgi:hypothetical protein